MLLFAENLKNKRLQSNMTQADFASKLNISHMTYNRYENGTRTPTIDVLLKMAEILHCPTDELLGHTPQITEYEQLKNELVKLGFTLDKQDKYIILAMSKEAKHGIAFPHIEQLSQMVSTALKNAQYEIDTVKRQSIISYMKDYALCRGIIELLKSKGIVITEDIVAKAVNKVLSIDPAKSDSEFVNAILSAIPDKEPAPTDTQKK